MGQIMSEISNEGVNTLRPGTAINIPSDSEEEGHNLLKKYEVGKLLGHGAFGKVYQARDLLSGQSVAIKSISKRRILKGNLAPHVKREILIMSRLRHPHIVHLHEVLATKTKIYSVMEFASGGELFSKIARGRFSEDLCRKCFQQLISAVSYCHSRGVFHRDLKPENLLLDDNWDMKVTDFGLSALQVDQVRGDGMLHTRCGTPAYVAPEILARKGYDGAKADVWSCGVILFAMSVGYLPFNNANVTAMYRKICRGEFRCPRWTSPDLRRLLARILDPNPSTRINVGEILRDPWFRKGGYPQHQPGIIKFPDPLVESDGEQDFKEAREGGGGVRYLNAFHLISYSSGADLSGLFSNSSRQGGGVRSEMFVSGESAERIIEGIVAVAVAEGEGVRAVEKKPVGVRLVHEDRARKWNFVVMVEVSRLTPELAVVRVKSGGSGLDFWEQKLKPRLTQLLGTAPGRTPATV